MSIVFIRTILIYLLVVTALRIMGKRQLGELQPSELVVTILVSNLATMSIEDSGIPLLETMVSIFTLVSCEVLVSLLIMKSNLAQKIFSGSPCVIIRDGKIDQREMKNLRWTLEDLLEQLRVAGVFDITEVSFAVVETSGALSCYQIYRSRPLTLDILEASQEDAPPVLVVSDGKIVDKNLTYCHISRPELEGAIKQRGLALPNIFLMTCDSQQNFTIVEKEGSR